MSLCIPVQGGYFPMGYLFPSFMEISGGQCTFLVPLACQVTLIQNHQNIIVEYFGVSCPGPKQWLHRSRYSLGAPHGTRRGRLCMGHRSPFSKWNLTQDPNEKSTWQWNCFAGDQGGMGPGNGVGGSHRHTWRTTDFGPGAPADWLTGS